MIKRAILLPLIFASLQLLYGQSVTISMTTNCFNPAVTVPYAMDFNGRPAYNTGTGNLGGLNPVQLTVLWASTRWEIRVGGSTPAYFNNQNTSNPPATGWQAFAASFPLGTCGVGDPAPTLSGDVTLPVDLLSFQGSSSDQVIYLQWETAAEVNNEGFVIEKSKDGITWQQIAFQAGTPRPAQVNSYRYTDTAPFPGHNYFRLKQMDFDGATTYSPVLMVKISSSKGDWVIAPNPFQQEVHIVLSTVLKNDTSFILFDAFGKKVSAFIFPQNTLSQTIDLSHLPKGMYLLRAKNGHFVKKIVRS